MKTTSSEPQLQWPDKREDDRDNIAKSAVRKSGESERWQREICAIGCMYLEHVDGRWLRRHRYGGGAGQSKTKQQQQQHFRPRRDRSRTPAGMPKGQGRRRKEGGIGTAMHAHAGWQGRLHTGKATYCTARLQPDEPAACGRGMAAVTSKNRRAAHPPWPITSLRGVDQGEVWSLQPCGLVRHAHTTTGVMARQRRRNPAKDVQTRARQPLTGKLRSCLALLYQPCLLCLGGRLRAFSLQGFGSTGAHHWPRPATGCRISRGWLPMRRGLWLERRWQLPR
jgi:hypothetical protein